MKRYVILSTGSFCPLCLDADARKKNNIYFNVTSDGGYTGEICAAHLAALIGAEDKKKPEPKKPEAPLFDKEKAAALPATAQPVTVRRNETEKIAGT